MTKKQKSKTPTNLRGLEGINRVMAIPPEDIEQLRRGVFNIVKSNLGRARDVVEGKRKWDNNQLKLYLALMNKVMPELSASYTETHTTHSMDDLTTDELQRIVAAGMAEAAKAAADPNHVLIDATPIPELVEEPQPLPSPILPLATP